MAFFLIVPSVMIVSVLLVHALTNRLGLRIYYTTLFAVAVLSFMITFSTTFMTPTIGREFLLRLGIMISAAALLTVANKFLLNKQLAEEKRFDEEVKAAYEEEKRKSKPAQVDKFAWDDESTSLAEKNFLVKDSTTPAYNEPLDVKEPSTTTETALDVKEPLTTTETALDDKEPLTTTETALDVKEPLTTTETALDVKEPSTTDDTELEVKEPSTTETKLEVKEPSTTETELEVKEPSTMTDTELDKNLESVEKFPLEKVFEPLPEIKSEEADKPVKLEEKKEPEEEFPLEEVFKPLPTVKPEELEKHKEPQAKPKEIKRTEFFPLQEVFRPLSTLKLKPSIAGSAASG